MNVGMIKGMIEGGLFRNDDAILCPYCGESHAISDPDVSSNVVSYWGDSHHNFSCSECGEDFRVKEIVIRHFETAKTDADFE